MKILNSRGDVARTATPKGFANNWISAHYTDGKTPGHGVVRPNLVQLETADEHAMFANRDPAVVGWFWKVWDINEQGGFVQHAQPPTRRRR